LRCAIYPWFEPPRAEMVDLLIAEGAAVPTDALLQAVEYRRLYDALPVVELLLKHGADPNVQNGFGSAMSNVLYRYPQNTALVEMLIHHGADVNPQAPLGKKPLAPLLSIAAWNRNPDILRLLIEAGADVSTAVAEGALHAAARRADHRTV